MYGCHFYLNSFSRFMCVIVVLTEFISVYSVAVCVKCFVLNTHFFFLLSTIQNTFERPGYLCTLHNIFHWHHTFVLLLDENYQTRVPLLFNQILFSNWRISQVFFFSFNLIISKFVLINSTQYFFAIANFRKSINYFI